MIILVKAITSVMRNGKAAIPKMRFCFLSFKIAFKKCKRLIAAQLDRQSERFVRAIKRKNDDRLRGGPFPFYVTNTEAHGQVQSMLIDNSETYSRYEFVRLSENWLEPINKTIRGQFNYLWNDVCSGYQQIFANLAY